MNCEICNFEAKPTWRVDGYQHHKCNHCFHVFVFPKPSIEQLASYYMDGTYYEDAAKKKEIAIAAGVHRCEIIKNRLSQKWPKLLDVGCATGLFMSVARDYNFEVTGMDVSPATAQKAMELTGLPVHVANIEEGHQIDKNFDVITAWEVIEHVLNPAKFLRAVQFHLQPGGLLALSTPRIDGLLAKVLGCRFPFILPPEHLSLFSRRSLQILARNNGFVIEHFESFSNLDAAALSRGFTRLIGGDSKAGKNSLVKSFINFAGNVCEPAVAAVDTMGQGTEMMVIMRSVLR